MASTQVTVLDNNNNNLAALHYDVSSVWYATSENDQTRFRARVSPRDFLLTQNVPREKALGIEMLSVCSDTLRRTADSSAIMAGGGRGISSWEVADRYHILAL